MTAWTRCCVHCWSGSVAPARRRTRRHCLLGPPASAEASHECRQQHLAIIDCRCLSQSSAKPHCNAQLTDGKVAVSRASYDRARKRCCRHLGPTSRSSISKVPVDRLNNPFEAIHEMHHKASESCCQQCQAQKVHIQARCAAPMATPRPKCSLPREMSDWAPEARTTASGRSPSTLTIDFCSSGMPVKDSCNATVHVSNCAAWKAAPLQGRQAGKC